MVVDVDVGSNLWVASRHASITTDVVKLKTSTVGLSCHQIENDLNLEYRGHLSC